MPKIKVNLPVFVYNNSHLSLKLLYLLVLTYDLGAQKKVIYAVQSIVKVVTSKV